MCPLPLKRLRGLGDSGIGQASGELVTSPQEDKNQLDLNKLVDQEKLGVRKTADQEGVLRRSEGSPPRWRA